MEVRGTRQGGGQGAQAQTMGAARWRSKYGEEQEAEGEEADEEADEAEGDDLVGCQKPGTSRVYAIQDGQIYLDAVFLGWGNATLYASQSIRCLECIDNT